MPIENIRFMHEALTRWNYFPNQKYPTGELPWSISTQNFTPEISGKLSAKELSPSRKKSGFDEIDYFMTRQNNVPRKLALVHPQAYSRLVETMVKNWGELAPLTDSLNSMIKPEVHLDGRILIMNYDGPHAGISRFLDSSFGMRVRVDTDVSGCFASVYSHSIAWAIQGFAEAKAGAFGRGDKHWSAQLDKDQSFCRRKETLGVGVGPGTSSILVEAILGCVDKSLREYGFSFRRYIDDYVCDCESEDKAREFLQVLAAQLSKFKMALNLHKTSFSTLPEPINDLWVSQLSSAMNSRLKASGSGVDQLFPDDAVHFIDYAIRLNKETPDGSVLKFAFSSIVNRADDSAIKVVADYLINLGWHFPVLLPYLDRLAARQAGLLENQEMKINRIIKEHARNRRSDGIAWGIHLLRTAELEVSEEVAEDIVASEDCVGISLLSTMQPGNKRILDFAKNVLSLDPYARDQQWLLIYQLYKMNVLACPDEEPWMDVLKTYDVDFIVDPDSKTLAEKYCDVVNNPFRGDSEIQDFDAWMQVMPANSGIG